MQHRPKIDWDSFNLAVFNAVPSKAACSATAHANYPCINARSATGSAQTKNLTGSSRAVPSYLARRTRVVSNGITIEKKLHVLVAQMALLFSRNARN